MKARLLIAVAALVLIACTPSEPAPPGDAGTTPGAWADLSAQQRLAYLNRSIESTKPLHKVLGKPKPGDWLAQHAERGQSFKQYTYSKPVRASGKRRIIYIQRIGTFSKEQLEVVAKAAECLGLFYGLEVRFLDDIKSVEKWPASAKRVHPSWGMKQLLSTHILDDVLAPNLPKDAAVLLGFSAQDLWPGRGWNFVFGQASLRKRVGVWSIYRNGDPADGKGAFKLCLLRTIKTATHETGHMFSMYHCTAYECNLCGSNNREESDRQPVMLCPECMPKAVWATGADPIERYRKLEAFYRRAGLEAQAGRYAKLRAAMPPIAAPAAKAPVRPGG